MRTMTMLNTYHAIKSDQMLRPRNGANRDGVEDDRRLVPRGIFIVAIYLVSALFLQLIPMQLAKKTRLEVL